MRRVFWLGLAFVVGLVTGGTLLKNSQPRSFAALAECGGHCYRPADLAGLLVSAGMRLAPGAMPKVVRETDTCVAIASPLPRAPKHFVFFPKRDIKDITDITPEDGPTVLGCFALMRVVIAEKQVRNYRIETNGPDRQSVTYLHWHLLGD